MWLDVGEVAVEEFLGAVDSERFELIVEDAPAVVACARVPLGVFVGQACAHGVHDGSGGVVFAGDEFDCSRLAMSLFHDDFGDGSVAFTKKVEDACGDCVLGHVR